MVDDKLDILLRTTDTTKMKLEQSKKFNNTKRKINRICKELSLNTQKYDPKKTVETIALYIASTNKLDRILYSEISNYIYSLEMFQRGAFATNLEKLLLYSLNDGNSISEDSKKIIVKIYDHSQLALHASIVLAFVGGITFSTSVLQNISAVSVFRLLLIVDFLAFVLINVIYILVKFIYTINEKNVKLFNIKRLNIACLVIAIIIVLSWILNVKQIPDFISKILPWSK